MELGWYEIVNLAVLAVLLAITFLRLARGETVGSVNCSVPGVWGGVQLVVVRTADSHGVPTVQLQARGPRFLRTVVLEAEAAREFAAHFDVAVVRARRMD